MPITNWKTSLFGMLFAVATAIGTGTVETSPRIQKIAAIVMAAAGAGGLFSAKDKDVTGGSKGQPSTVAALAAANQAPATGIDRPRNVV